jgi:tetratricopeptide (TPR) repeat protein
MVFAKPIIVTMCAGVLGLASLGGCADKAATHKQAVDNANQRWLGMRSGLMLQMAQQQFDTGDLDKAEKTLVDALAIDPGNAELHVLAGRVALERGQLERAFNRLNVAIELKDNLAEAYYFQGIVLQRWQQFDGALLRYERAYELVPDNASFLLAVGEMLVATEQEDVALALLADKSQYFDQNAGIRVALAQLYAMQRKYDKALYFLRQAMLLRPDDLQIVEDLAFVSSAAGRHSDAARHLERLLADPSFRDRTDLRRALADAYLPIGRSNDARTIYVELTRRDPRDADAWLRLAELSWQQSDLGATMTAANRLMAVAPDREEGFLLAGLVWQQRGRLDEAISMFDQAATLSPTKTYAVILRGIALERAGRRDAAAAAYAEALRRQPDDPRAQHLLAAVRQP